MTKIFLSIASLLFFTSVVCGQQPTREELEKERIQLKKDLEETERLLKDNQSKTKESLGQLTLINKKVNLQDRVVDNINKDINLLDNNIYTIQKDINRYDHLLDTLKQEYTRSMIYAYKNRTNYDLLNFVFAASSFNDAIKRMAYLKNYRTYREMQGENILRTQELRRNRLDEMAGVKEKKNAALDVKSKELDELEKQKQEKDRITENFKKQGKELNKQYAAKKKQMSKVTTAITAVIRRAQDEARKAAIAKALEDKKNAVKSNTPVTENTPNTNIKSVGHVPKKVETNRQQENFPLSAENTVLNDKFENQRGALSWPVDKGYILMHFGPNKLPSGNSEIDYPGISIATDIGNPVKVVFNGTVTSIITVEDMQVVMVQHGRYFTSYSNLSGVTVQKGQTVTKGQVVGRAMANDEGQGEVDFIMSNDKSNFDPEKWLLRR